MKKDYLGGNKGFTLLELLIVVAIIAILAAIAIPNFLAAQTRSKVSRCNKEERELINSLESYFVDYNDYPYSHRLRDLTTPISYMSSLPNDIFGNERFYIDPYTLKPIYIWVKREDTWQGIYSGRWGAVISWGPWGPTLGDYAAASQYWAETDGIEYDPSNGIISKGRIFRLVPGNLKQLGTGYGS